jgi:ABC-type transporter Mla subunit MlaD
MDIEKAMEFILGQNARHAVAMQQLDERMEQAEKRMDRTEGMVRQLVDVTMSLARHVESLARHAEDADAWVKKFAAETDRRIREREEAGAHTDRRLDALIDVVEKLTRRNGSHSK